MPVLRLFAEDFVIFWRYMDAKRTEEIVREHLSASERARFSAFNTKQVSE